jgi:hypothetical protein
LPRLTLLSAATTAADLASPQATRAINTPPPDRAAAAPPSPSSRSDTNTASSADDPTRRLDVLRLVHEELPRAYRGLDAIVAALIGTVVWLCIGETKAGKSTTAAWLTGRTLAFRRVKVKLQVGKETVQEERDIVDYKEERDRTDPQLPALGHSLDSCTDRMQPVAIGDHVFVLDAAGHGDTKDKTFGVANTVAISTVLHRLVASTTTVVRPIFFINYQSFGRPNFMTDQLQLLERLFPNFEDVAESVLFVYTHLADTTTQGDIASSIAAVSQQRAVQGNPTFVLMLEKMLSQLRQSPTAVMVRPTENSPDALKKAMASMRSLPATAQLGLPLTDVEMKMVLAHLHDQGVLVANALERQQFRDALESLNTMRSLIHHLALPEFEQVYAGHRRRVVQLVDAMVDHSKTSLAVGDFQGCSGTLHRLRAAKCLGDHLQPDTDLEVTFEEIAITIRLRHGLLHDEIAGAPSVFHLSKVANLHSLQALEQHLDNFFATDSTSRDLLAALVESHTAAIKAASKLQVQLRNQSTGAEPSTESENSANALFRQLETLLAACSFACFPELQGAEQAYAAACAKLKAFLEAVRVVILDEALPLLQRLELTPQQCQKLACMMHVAGKVGINEQRFQHVSEDLQELFLDCSQAMKETVTMAICTPLLDALRTAPVLFGSAAQALQQLAQLDACDNLRALLQATVAAPCRALCDRLVEKQHALRKITDALEAHPAANAAQDNSFWRDAAVVFEEVRSATALDKVLASPSVVATGCTGLVASSTLLAETATAVQKHLDGLVERLAEVFGPEANLQLACAAIRNADSMAEIASPCTAPLERAVAEFLQQAQTLDPLTAPARMLADMTYRGEQAHQASKLLRGVRLLGGRAEQLEALGTVATELLARIARDGKAQAKQLAEEVDRLSSQLQLEECVAKLIQLQALGTEGGILVTDDARMWYKAACDQLTGRVTEAELTVNRLFASNDLSQAQAVRSRLRAGLGLQLHVNVIEAVVQRLNAELATVLRQAEAMCQQHLESGNYADIVAHMAALQAANGNDEQAQYRHLQQVIRTKLAKDVRTHQTFLGKLSTSMELKDTSELADLERSPLIKLEACSDFVELLTPLTGVVPDLGLQQLEDQLQACTCTAFETLHKRVHRSLQWMQFAETEKLMQALTICNVWHRLPEECRERMAQTKDEIDKLADQLLEYVLEQLQKHDGRQLARVSAAVDQAASKGVFANRHNFQQLAESIEENIRRWLHTTVETLQRQMNQNLDEAKVTMGSLCAVAVPLREKCMAPFGRGGVPAGDGNYPAGSIAAEVAQAEKAYLDQLRYRSMPKITPEGAEAIVEDLSTVNGPASLDALISITRDAVENAMERIQRAEVDDMAEVSLAEACELVNGLTHLHSLLQQEPLHSFKRMLDALQLEERTKSSSLKLRSLVQNAAKNVREHLKAFRLDAGRRLVHQLESVMASGHCPRVLQGSESDEVKRLAQALDTLASTMVFGADAADAARLDAQGDAFDPPSIVQRWTKLQTAAAHFQNVESAFLDPRETGETGETPSQSFAKLKQHWEDQLATAQQAVDDGIAQRQAVPLTNIALNLFALHQQQPPAAGLDEKVSRVFQHISSQLTSLHNSLTLVVSQAMNKERWDELHTLIAFAKAVDAELGSLYNVAFARVITTLVSQRVASLDDGFSRACDVDTYARHLASLQGYRAGCNLPEIAGMVFEKIRGHVEAATFDVLDFASALSQTGLHGEQIKHSFPRFEAARIRERQEATRGMSLEATLKMMVEGMPDHKKISPDQKARIESLYGLYRGLYDSMVARPDTEIHSLVVAAKRMAQIFQDAKPNPERMVELLAHVTAVWSLQSRSSLSAVAGARGIYMEPHVIQVIGIFELLGMTSFKPPKWWKMWASSPEWKDLKGTFVECLTGESQGVRL